MLVRQFDVGGDRNYGYIAAEESSKEAFLVDPAYSPGKLLRYVEEKGFIIKYNFCTHGHYDHTNGNETVRKSLGIVPLLYGSIEPVSGQSVKDGVKFSLGSLQLTIIHTPGHTQDSMCIFVGNALFTGDTLFVGKVGGTDFGSGARQEYNALHEKLLKLFKLS